ncbi:hypothetical protein ASC77_10740 [Nocardioides sp. Root1257]|uniref:hypothetical protein n=1 Tax=unclassified Nocardioides TaxID=2615069 RepID=UPI0006F9B809|nr:MULTISPECIES: hypothetical protein [unclassified Nocardioides]KQW49162.1 hypothetical protein ASC77_10740 [Nocardioides sp. Root1257]KRC48336.1 hypothetical protein ASE24_10745 [Nocardioides sp. Root224]
MKTLLALLVTAALASGCTGSAGSPVVVPAPQASSPSTLVDLPRGDPPRIGYADGDTWVAPDGTRTKLPTTFGISSITPYAGGFLVADTRYFEGSVGLWFVTEHSARDLGCSTGATRRVDGWVWWVTAFCPESLAGDLARTVVHRARPDGREHTRRVFRPEPGVAMFVRIGRYLDRVAPVPTWVPEDAHHRLAVRTRRGWTAVVRVDDAGRRELATEPVRQHGADLGFVLGPGR